MSPRVVRMKLIWSVWLPDEMEHGNVRPLQLNFAFCQDLALLQGGMGEVIPSQPLIFLLHFHPDCGCLLSSAFG